jgi:hypothetical protein
MVGWITQIIFGVAWWIFPRFENASKGNENLAWLLYLLLNSGLIIRTVAEPQNTLYPEGLWAKLLILSAFLQFNAGLIYVFILWPRVRGKKAKVGNK